MVDRWRNRQKTVKTKVFTVFCLFRETDRRLSSVCFAAYLPFIYGVMQEIAFLRFPKTWRVHRLAKPGFFCRNTHRKEIQIGFGSFLVPAHPGSPRQNPESCKTVVVVVTHTTQPFCGCLDFVRDYLGEPVPER